MYTELQCMCVHASVCSCVCVCVRVYVYVCVCVCSRTHSCMCEAPSGGEKLRSLLLGKILKNIERDCLFMSFFSKYWIEPHFPGNLHRFILNNRAQPFLVRQILDTHATSQMPLHRTHIFFSANLKQLVDYKVRDRNNIQPWSLQKWKCDGPQCLLTDRDGV